MNGTQAHLSQVSSNIKIPCKLYLDGKCWEEFVDWVHPEDPTDLSRLEMIKTGTWKIMIFREQLNRCFSADRSRDRYLAQLGIEIVSATGPGKLDGRDELFLSEILRTYFHDDPYARRQAELLLLARRHSASSWLNVVSQHKGFWRSPYVNAFWINDQLDGDLDISAMINILSDFGIHPRIAETVRSRLLGNDYSSTVFEAWLALRNMIRELTGLTTDGAQLMEQAFAPNNPMLYLYEPTLSTPTASQRNEQRGYQEIYRGVAKAIRNTFAHEGPASQFAQVRVPDRITLYKYLCFLSLLCERAENPLP